MCHAGQDIPNGSPFDRHRRRVARAGAGCKASQASIQCPAGERSAMRSLYRKALTDHSPVSIRASRIAAWRSLVQGLHKHSDVISVPQRLVDVRLLDCIKKRYRLASGRLKIKGFERIAKSVERPAYDVRQPSGIGGRMQPGMEPRQVGDGRRRASKSLELPARWASNSFSQQTNKRS